MLRGFEIVSLLRHMLRGGTHSKLYLYSLLYTHKIKHRKSTQEMIQEAIVPFESIQTRGDFASCALCGKCNAVLK